MAVIAAVWTSTAFANVKFVHRDRNLTWRRVTFQSVTLLSMIYMLATHEMFSLQLRLLVSQEERMRAVKNRLWFWSVLCLRGIELPRTWKRLKTLTSLILRKKLKSPKKMRLKMQIPKVKRQRMSSRNHLKQLLEKKQLQEKIQNKMRRQNLEREMEMRRKQKKSKKKK